MDTQSSQRELGYLWAIIAVARERPLTEADHQELARVCKNLQGKLPKHDEIAAVTDALCQRINTSRDPGTNALLEPERLLGEIDRLRQMLEWFDTGSGSSANFGTMRR